MVGSKMHVFEPAQSGARHLWGGSASAPSQSLSTIQKNTLTPFSFRRRPIGASLLIPLMLSKLIPTSTCGVENYSIISDFNFARKSSLIIITSNI